MERVTTSPKNLSFLGSEVREESFSYYRRLARVRRYVFANYAEPITLEDTAKVAGMEKTAFSTFFHHKTGICFHDWLAAVRVMKSMEFISISNRPLREVGRRAGFPNVRTFERVFLRVTGQAPIEYKKSVRPS